MNFEQLKKEIKERSQEKQPLLVAISGYGGAGKTTLTKRLKSELEDVNVINLDDFITNSGRGSGWQGGFDWTRLEQTIKDAKAGKDLRYQYYDWEKDETTGWIEQKAAPIIIIEGVRLFQPALNEYYDLKVWMDVDVETASKRGKARDQNHDEEWDNIWVPKDIEYAQLFKPKNTANILYAAD